MNQGWRVDKHIPLAVIVTIAIQTAAIVWYTAKMDARVATLEEKRAVDDQQTVLLLREVSDIGKRLVRVETLLETRLPKGGMR